VEGRPGYKLAWMAN